MSRLITIASFLLLWIAAASAQFSNPSNDRFQQANSLVVTARAADGSPLANARVAVSSLGVRAFNTSAVTNALGVAEIANIPNGTYEVNVSIGVDQANDRIDVFNSDAQVSLRLTTTADASAGNGQSVSVAQMKVPEKARNLFSKAREAAEKQKFEDAERHLAKALESCPWYAEALTMRGLLKLDRGDEAGARDDFDASIKADSSYSLAYFAMGALMNKAQEFDNAVRVLERGLTAAPNAWQGYFEMAKAQIGKGDYSAALRSLDRAQDFSKGKYAPIHLLKGHALLAQREYDHAMVELEAFLKQSPKDANAGAAEKMLSQAKAFVGRQ